MVILLGFLYTMAFSPKTTYQVDAFDVVYTPEIAAQAADTVLIGTIKKVKEPKWNSKDGKKPGKDSPNQKLIYKPTIVEVEEYYKNPKDDKKIEIINPGGTIDKDTVVLKGIPSNYAEGQKVVFFLLDNIDPGDGEKRYDPFWSYSVSGDVATDMVTGEQLSIENLKEKIITQN